MDAALDSLKRMRLAGKRPPGPIFVTDDFGTAQRARNLGLYSVRFKPGETCDWRVLRALSVIVSTTGRREAVAPVMAAIFEQAPRYLMWADGGPPINQCREPEWVIPCPQ